MSDFIIAKFSDLSSARSASAILQRPSHSILKVQASAVLYKDWRGRVSVYDRVERTEYALVAGAFIGGLAGLGVGALAALLGAIGGALVGITAAATNLEARAKLFKSVARDIGSDKAILLAHVEAEDADALREMIRNLGGVLLNTAKP